MKKVSTLFLFLSLIFSSTINAQVFMDYCVAGQVSYTIVSETDGQLVFDVWLNESPTSNCGSIYLAATEIVINYNPSAFTAPTLIKMDQNDPVLQLNIGYCEFTSLIPIYPFSNTILQSSYNSATSTTVLNNQFIINISSPSPSDQASLENGIAFIATTPTRIGRFKASGYFGSAHGLDISFTTDLLSQESKAFSFEPGGMFGAYRVNLSDYTLIKDGVEHHPMGNSTLSIDQDGSLNVTNIGFSGMDGVSIDFNAAEFGLVTFDSIENLPIPIGASRTISPVGHINGLPNQEIGIIQQTATANGSIVSVDFSPLTPSEYKIMVYNDGSLMTQANSQSIEVISPNNWALAWDPSWPMPDTSELWAIFESSETLTVILNGDQFDADQVVIIARTDEIVGKLNRLNITASNIPQLKISKTEVGMFHNAHLAQGNTHILANNDKIELSNMGQSGEDGVDINIGEAASWDATWSLFDVQNLPNGAYNKIESRGSRNGVEDQLLGRTTVTDVGIEAEIQFEFFDAQGELVPYIIEIWNQGVKVDSEVAMNFPTARIRTRGCRGRFWRWLRDDVLPYLLDLAFSRPVAIIQVGSPEQMTITSHTTVMGDMVVAYPKIPQEDIEHVSSFSFRTSGVGSMEILDEQVIMEDAPSDTLIVFGGLSHYPVGNSILTVTNDTLQVSDIGNSGLDGVDINLGEAKGWGFTIDDGYAADLFPLGSFVEWTMVGVVDGAVDSTIFTERVEVAEFNSETLWAVKLDKSAIGATQSVVRIYGENEELLYDEIHDNGIAFYIESLEYVVQWDNTCVVLPPIPRITLLDSTYISNATRIENFAYDAQAVVTACTKIENRAAGIGSFTMKNEGLAFFSPPLVFSVDGQETVMTAESTGLTINNVDSPYMDIDIELDQVENISLEYKLDGLQAGSSIQIVAEGFVGGIPDQALGEVNIDYDGQNYQISADYSSIGTSSYRLELYDNDNVVAIIDNYTDNDIASTTMTPRGCGKGIPPFPPQLPCYILYQDLGEITLSNDTTYVADELRILAANATDAPEYLSHFKIATKDIPSIKFEKSGVTQMQMLLPLQENWNWVTPSFANDDSTVSHFFENYPVSNGDLIKSQTEFSQFVSGQGWLGSLKAVKVGNTYQIKVAQASDLTLSGNLVQGVAAQVDFQPGWNWKTPIVTQVTPINNAFYTGTSFENNDLIKTQTEFAAYIESGLNQWVGSLATLEAGEGTLVYNLGNTPNLNENNSTNKILGLPIDWIPLTGLQYNMNFTGEVVYDLPIEATDYIAAFVGSECRGVVKIQDLGGNKLVFLTVASSINSGELITFRFYDASEDLVLPVSNTYTFTSDEIVGDFFTPFQFLIANLPLELSAFEATPTRDKKVQLTWQTASETNTDYFGLEKSTNAEDWTGFGKVTAAGNSTNFENYEFLDRFPFSGNNYYRLKMVDKDGTFTYSPVRVINFKEERISYIFPNPIKGTATLYYELDENISTVHLGINNMLGQQVKQFALATDSNSFLLDVNDLPNGIYHYSLYVDGERVEVFKVLVLN